MATLFLAGDVMTGRGIDRVLPHGCAPRLYETRVQSAREYVELAERANGPIAAPVAWDYVWGDALDVLDRKRPDARIANLETAVTAGEEPWPDKGIHYRMHPANMPVLRAARIDACALANNHVLDWGRKGLSETLRTLAQAGIRTAGAGEDEAQAAAPAAIPLREGGRILLFSHADGSSGVPRDWAATRQRPGVSRLADLSPRAVEHVMYFPAFDAGGRLVRFEIVPMALRRFRIGRADASQARALASVLARESARLGTRVEPRADGELSVDIIERAA
jgi:poly-gamma-glutamate synthesis protein (capsule biosynthesis protein)